MAYLSLASRMRRPPRRGRQHVIAVVAAIGVHALLLFGILASAPGVVSRGASDPYADGEGVEVMLSGREGAQASARQGETGEAEAQSQLDAMLNRLRNAPSDFYVQTSEPERPRGSLSELFDALGKDRAKGRKGDGADAAGANAAGGQDARTAATSRTGGVSDDASSGDLWGQVEPCWSRLPQRSTVPVMLEVTLNDKGTLAGPPRIMRPAGAAPDEPRLVAEARALTAIAGCIPYKQVALPGTKRVFQLSFQKDAAKPRQR